MDEIFKAMGFGIRVTIWIFRQVFIGYADLFKWYAARGVGDNYPFPFLTVGLSIVLTVFLIWFFTAGPG